MDYEARCAFVIAQAACATAEIAAMQAENQICIQTECSLTYDEKAFRAVESTYMISHNAVIEYLRE